MTGPARRGRLALGLLSLLALPGCLSYLNPAPPPPEVSRDACAELPEFSRGGVYVILVNGADLFECGNLAATRDYLKTLGFVKTYYAQLCHEGFLVEEVRRLRHDDPRARFVLVGYGHGATTARKVAWALEADEIVFDALVYLDPKGVVCADDAATLRVGRFIVVLPEKALGATEVEGAEVLTVNCRSGFGVPTHPATLSLLADEAAALAQLVPVPPVKVEGFPQILESAAPPPRPVLFENWSEKPDEWDFLKSSYLPRPKWEETSELLLPPREKEDE
jgi:hypothetical protein